MAVHGIRMIKAHKAGWSCNQTTNVFPWLAKLLPMHVPCGKITAFIYDCEDIREGIGIDVVVSLATQLLDQVQALQMLVSAAEERFIWVYANGCLKQNDHIVFVAEDLGGLIVEKVS